MLYILFNNSFAPCTQRLACNSWKSGSASDLGAVDSAGGLNEDFACWNWRIYLMIWLVGIGEYTWFAPPWGGKDNGSLLAWATTIGAASSKVTKWVTLDPLIHERSGVYRCGNSKNHSWFVTRIDWEHKICGPIARILIYLGWEASNDLLEVVVFNRGKCENQTLIPINNTIVV